MVKLATKTVRFQVQTPAPVDKIFTFDSDLSFLVSTELEFDIPKTVGIRKCTYPKVWNVV